MRPRVLAVCFASASNAQDSVEQFYRGKNLTLVIASNVGGG